MTTRKTAPAKDVKVRRTVDLTAKDHAALAAWCAETAGELGKARVSSQDVLATLVQRLLTDEVLSRKIKADLRSLLRKENEGSR